MTSRSTHVPHLICSLPEASLIRLVTVLQAGFLKEVPAGTRIIDFLSSLPGFTPDYIQNRIQTVFLDGNAIDDLDNFITGPRSTIALSAAMPGLAGAILRRNSPHASLRRAPAIRETSDEEGSVQVSTKLFNAIIVERGPELFAHGILLRAKDIFAFLELRPNLLESMHNIRLDGRRVANPELLKRLQQHDTLFFKSEH